MLAKDKFKEDISPYRPPTPTSPSRLSLTRASLQIHPHPPQELSRVLNGDAKTEVTPVFHVTMVLERNAHVELQPTIQILFDMIHKVSRDLITVVQIVPRVALTATDRQRRDLEVSYVSQVPGRVR